MPTVLTDADIAKLDAKPLSDTDIAAHDASPANRALSGTGLSVSPPKRAPIPPAMQPWEEPPGGIQPMTAGRVAKALASPITGIASVPGALADYGRGIAQGHTIEPHTVEGNPLEQAYGNAVTSGLTAPGVPQAIGRGAVRGAQAVGRTVRGAAQGAYTGLGEKSVGGAALGSTLGYALDGPKGAAIGGSIGGAIPSARGAVEGGIRAFRNAPPAIEPIPPVPVKPGAATLRNMPKFGGPTDPNYGPTQRAPPRGTFTPPPELPEPPPQAPKPVRPNPNIRRLTKFGGPTKTKYGPPNPMPRRMGGTVVQSEAATVEPSAPGVPPSASGLKPQQAATPNLVATNPAAEGVLPKTITSEDVRAAANSAGISEAEAQAQIARNGYQILNRGELFRMTHGFPGMDHAALQDIARLKYGVNSMAKLTENQMLELYQDLASKQGVKATGTPKTPRKTKFTMAKGGIVTPRKPAKNHPWRKGPPPMPTQRSQGGPPPFPR